MIDYPGLWCYIIGVLRGSAPVPRSQSRAWGITWMAISDQTYILRRVYLCTWSWLWLMAVRPSVPLMGSAARPLWPMRGGGSRTSSWGVSPSRTPSNEGGRLKWYTAPKQQHSHRKGGKQNNDQSDFHFWGRRRGVCGEWERDLLPAPGRDLQGPCHGGLSPPGLPSWNDT